MTDKQPVQASGDGERKDAPDGVENAPGKTSAGGESGGGAYPDPDGGAKGGTGGFFGHGGQSEQDYSGPGDKDDPDGGNANAVTR